MLRKMLQLVKSKNNMIGNFAHQKKALKRASKLLRLKTTPKQQSWL